MNSLDGLVEFLDFLGFSEDQAPAGIGVAALEGNINAYKNLLGNVGKDYAIGLASGIGNSFMGTLGDSLKNNVSVSIKRKFQIKTTGETGVIEILMHADPNKTNNVGDLVAELNSIRLFSAASVTSIVAKAKEVWKSEKDDDSDSNRFQSTSPTMHVKVIFRYKPDSSTENSSTQSDDAGLTPQLTITTIDEGVVQDGASTHIVSNLLSTAISVLRTLMPELEKIAHLVSNYKTNKARYLSSSSLKISSILSLVKKAQGWLSSNDDEFEPLVEKAFKEMEKKAPEATGEVCPECGGDLVIRSGKYGEFVACSNYPTCKYIKKEKKEVTEVCKCPKCDKGMIVERKTKKGKIFYGCNNYPKCNYALWYKPTGEVCPKCGELIVDKNGSNVCLNCDNSE